MEKFKTPISQEGMKRELVKLWGHINKMIHIIHNGNLNEAQKRMLDARLVDMTEKYANADLNNKSCFIPDWMLSEDVFDVSKIVERFIYRPAV